MLLRNKLSGNFSQIPNELITDSELSDTAYRIVSYLFTKPDKWNVNNTDIQKKFNIKRRETMSKYWKEILKSGWVSRERKTSKGKQLAGFDYSLSINLDERNLTKIVYASTVHGEIKSPKTVHGENRTHSNTDNFNNTEKKICEVTDVFEYWKLKLNHPKAKLDDVRKRTITKSLKNYSIDELKKAIDGVFNTPHNMGDNQNKKKYDSIGLIFRNSDQIERFINNAPKIQTASLGGRFEL